MVFSKIKEMRAFMRVAKNLDKVGSDLPPDEAVVLDAPVEDPPLLAAEQAASSGDWLPAARLLAHTQSGPDWELRDYHVNRLSDVALEGDAWLNAWLHELPDDPNALLLHGDVLIGRAWEARGAKYAKYTSDEQFAGFFHYLGQVEPVLLRAAQANPADPCPWIRMLTYAMGSPGGRREVFDRAWAEVTDRAPHHQGAHGRALQYVCGKWHGSDEEMFAFAYRAADAAPPDSALQVLPLEAWLEYDVTKDGPVLTRPEVREAVNRALAVCPPNAPATYRWHRSDRNLIIRNLWVQERNEEALEQFRAAGVHATSYPWNLYRSEDPRQQFLDVREGVRMAIAETMP
ncbi:MAG: hypothetical protein M0026_08070 [Nocardiopsaceae bacterium]|nr:hypothetical protein [Nocardiopsaceae bacterium]